MSNDVEGATTTQPDLSEFELQLVTFLDQQYNLTGSIPSAEQAYKDYGIPVKQYTKAITSDHVRAALIERGVVFERIDNDEWTAKALTPIQLLAANALLDLTDTRTNKKKLQDLGVSTIKYQAWLKDPVFNNYMRTRTEQMLGENKHEAALALLDRVRAGDMKAVTFYYELTGQYVPASRSQSGNVDVHGILVKVIEIINEEVDDQATALAISDRLRSLIGANNIARALVNEDPIIVPEVVANREIPKELGNGNL